MYFATSYMLQKLQSHRYLPIELVIFTSSAGNVDVSSISDENVKRRRHHVRRSVETQRDGVRAAAGNETDSKFGSSNLELTAVFVLPLVVLVHRTKEKSVEELGEHSVAADADDSVDVVDWIGP